MYNYIQIYFVVACALLLQSCRQDRSDIVHSYLLPSEHLDTILQSFSIDTFKNFRALKNLNAIDRARDSKHLLNIITGIELGFFGDTNKNKDKNKNVYTIVYLKYKTDIRNTLNNPSLLWEEKKLKTIYLFAFFLHEFYLYSAEKGSLTLKATEGKKLYTQLAKGEIPDCLKYRKPKQEPGADTWILGFILLILLLLATLLALKVNSYGLYNTIYSHIRKWRTQLALDNKHIVLEKKDIIDQPTKPDTSNVPKDALTDKKSGMGNNSFNPIIKPSDVDRENEPPAIKNGQIEIQQHGSNKITKEKDRQKDEASKMVPEHPTEHVRKPDLDATNSENVSVSPAIETKYVGPPNGKYFYRFYDLEHIPPGEVYFRLIINTNNQKEADILLPDDPESLGFLLNSPAELGKVCIWHGGAVTITDSDVQYDKGKAAFKSQYWIIVNKIKIHE